ncbi:hypothetical protein [Pontibacillus litoralis]|uniref:Uncharacterized protein n=1 Tax=Pontibacillus litoralis JSM 072002 TaxID=1385512 RepID=A0A0A5GAY1_9BACI|nr:hypothetical protein [Pontibacillus litoralis]KGX88275.1 hypothetical protein N784_10875 [Pontibacillus litoralis JSM 072002]
MDVEKVLGLIALASGILKAITSSMKDIQDIVIQQEQRKKNKKDAPKKKRRKKHTGRVKPPYPITL